MRCDRIAYAKLTPILRGTYAAQTSLTPRCPGPLSARLSLDRVTRGYFARSTSRREGPSGRMGADNAGLWCPPQEARVARGAHPERAARVAWGRGMWALAWASGARLRPVIATAIASNCHPRQMNDRNGTSDGSPGIAPPCALPGLPPRPPQGAPCGAVHSNVDEPGLSARPFWGTTGACGQTGQLLPSNRGEMGRCPERLVFGECFARKRIFGENLMDTLGIEPRASRMLSGCNTTTPCALLP